MNIQERLKNLRPYVTGLRFVNDMPVVDAILTEGWKLLKNDKILVKKSENINQFFFYSEDPELQIDIILDFVEKCINHNKELELKTALFQEYVNMLKEIFKNTSYEVLKTLEFKIPKKMDVGDSELHVDHHEEETK
jgi:hypothetical protein